MGDRLKIKYVGPLDHYVYQGIRFARFKPIPVPDQIAHEGLAHPDVFLTEDEEVPADVLALRWKYADALEAEGIERRRQYQRVLSQAELMKDDSPDDKTRKKDAIAGATEEVVYADALISKAHAWREKVKLEQAEEAKAPKAKAAV